MTKQQLRESIRRVIKQELDEAKVIGKTKSGKDIYLDFNNPAHKNFTAADHDDASQVLLIGKSSASISSARKAAAKQHFLSSKAKQKMSENAPAPSKPSTSPGVKEPPAKTPGKKEPRRPLGNPNVQPAPKAKTKATMKEAEMLKQVIKRFKSKK